MSNLFLDQKYREFKREFENLTDYQLVNTFNKETSHNGWVSTRASYLKALYTVFIERDINVTAVYDNGFKLGHTVYLSIKQDEKVLIPITREWLH